jgi:alpha-N-arabinofuranosidase
MQDGHPTGAVISISREPLCPGRINPYQYGQFVEYLGDLVPAMWAEKLYDGSFEGLSRYNYVFLAQTDFREKPWYPTGQVNRAAYALDPEGPVGGAVSQRIRATGEAPCTVGIAQDGLAIAAGQPLLFSCYLRQEGVQGPVQVRLHGDGAVYATCAFMPVGEWARYEARLLPTGGDVAATLSILFRGPGTVWIDSASLMPEDTCGGWRPDVVEAVRAAQPGIIRFGGSEVDHSPTDRLAGGNLRWRTLVDPADRRSPIRAWGGLQPAGAGLEEIVQFIRSVGAEPLLCVRFGAGTAEDIQEAADEVEYFNGAPETPMGALRAAGGHPAPYAITYWQIGNEMRGALYEAHLAAFCRAMKRVDPGIKLLASYPSAGVLRAAGDLIDYVCPHHYDCADLAGTAEDILAVKELCRKHAPGRSIKIAVTEWNTTAGEWGPTRAGLWTLRNALAVARYHNLLHRHCDAVEIANRSNLINSACSGMIQTDRHRLYKTPAYYAQQLYATLGGTRPLRVEPCAPLDVSATSSEDGDILTLFVVNPTQHEVPAHVDLSAFGEAAAFGGTGSVPPKGGAESCGARRAPAARIAVWTLADREQAGEPDAANSFADPARVSTVATAVSPGSPRFAYRFPPLSLTVLRGVASG